VPLTEAGFRLKRNRAAMSTDAEWQVWAENDPYFGVLTEERFRRAALNAAALEEFFATGRQHVAEVLAACRRHFGEFSTARALDFGCGVGRLLIPLAEVSEQAVGVDIASAMLEEAARNCARYGRRNVRFARTLEELGAAGRGGFTFIHSHIVLQHLEAQHGLDIIGALLGLLEPGGVAALQVTYAHTKHRANLGVRPRVSRLLRFLGRPLRRMRRQLAGREPQMLMNPYDLNRVLFLAQSCGVRHGGLRFTDHAGHWGVMFFLRRD
jgi:SAM-dependent methyltransferase